MSLQARIRHRAGTFRLDVEFAVPDIGITALFGPSGAGKTSIVHALAGLTRPEQGRIVIGGETVLDTERNIFVPAERRRAGLVFQDARLFPHMTVENNLLFGWRRSADQAGPDDIAALVRLLGLEKLLARSPRRLSGGEKARVALGRALLSSPRLLLLDEPLASLDAARRDEILPWLEKLRDHVRLPMIYVSHSVTEVARLADTVVLLEDGKVRAQGAAADILTGLANPAGDKLGGLITAVVSGRRGDGLTELVFEGGVLLLALEAPAGQRLRLRIAADDILIALGEPGAISANNVLRAKIASVRVTAGLADIALHAGSAPLVARITAASAQRLALQAGMEVFAVIKSVAVDRPGPD